MGPSGRMGFARLSRGSRLILTSLFCDTRGAIQRPTSAREQRYRRYYYSGYASGEPGLKSGHNGGTEAESFQAEELVAGGCMIGFR
jgi:hypothetical protein